MKIALILEPWYKRESHPPDLAMVASILKRGGYENTVWDINTFMFHDTFAGRRYWKHFY